MRTGWNSTASRSSPRAPIRRRCRHSSELLVRMRDDDGELTLPGEFMPAAERHNIVGAIDRWVVEQAVMRLRQCLAAGREVPLLAVNLSGAIAQRARFSRIRAGPGQGSGHRARPVLRHRRGRGHQQHGPRP